MGDALESFPGDREDAMHIDMIVGLVLIFFVVVVPILGITARLAFKPVVDSVLALRDAMRERSSDRREKVRIEHLQDEVAELRHMVKELEEARDWEASLIPPGQPDLGKRGAGPSQAEAASGPDRST